MAGSESNLQVVESNSYTKKYRHMNMGFTTWVRGAWVWREGFYHIWEVLLGCRGDRKTPASDKKKKNSQFCWSLSLLPYYQYLPNVEDKCFNVSNCYFWEFYQLNHPSPFPFSWIVISDVPKISHVFKLEADSVVTDEKISS